MKYFNVMIFIRLLLFNLPQHIYFKLIIKYNMIKMGIFLFYNVNFLLFFQYILLIIFYLRNYFILMLVINLMKHYHLMLKILLNLLKLKFLDFIIQHFLINQIEYEKQNLDHKLHYLKNFNLKDRLLLNFLLFIQLKYNYN